MLKNLSSLMDVAGMSGLNPLGGASLLGLCYGSGAVGVICHDGYGAYCPSSTGQTCDAGAVGVKCYAPATAGAKCGDGGVIAVSCSITDNAAHCYYTTGVIQC
ncbi:MAG: hypothetical protein GTO55_11625 [Armatimonadetes bacterium]|nr:hypothetical protein [Armatimonadota bacterium]NIM24865.1 hypothetical protein [Armatimonadota bacterium]NIM68755.1 hypothetical protein [Armatimonadota bacterium]NIM77016.1 hypothetical protein [Armatimonadota bacterium]NIN06952.1 hypothetical protein [Armatimonadota bacterium]